MLDALILILDIQELDMQMIQLLRLRNSREKDLKKLTIQKESLQQQVETKEKEQLELKKNIRILEGELNEILTKFKHLESQQQAIKKVDEFNALSHEMSQVERERIAKEQRLSEAYDRLAAEEANLKTLSQSYETTVKEDATIEQEIQETIKQINTEGRALKAQRDKLVSKADPEAFRIYERLLRNKKDRVVVPIENRCCSGCHIMVTAQDENLVRKGERLVFCEHCSRIHYWQESQALESTEVVAKPRRRRAPAKAKA